MLDKTLDEVIDQQESWTFSECVGLGADFGLRTRMVIVKVLARGKEYIDGDRPPGHADS